ncbi:flippase [Lactobacillus delbrueckii]|uniref:flippase n=1 Tax=Lactobacillus delbrueckii TaxID=1584 RepID=UPI0006832D6B|nr:flippase [Lactobacillus delbrueckii]APG75357.1 poly-gamma-glutamate biosynthesis protein [Lactobacillus delbrueckii subsp. sunkii]KNE73508.1 poly-gamma-glutamate biosynthesis protein [Lactobacillus delbrueckii subsp. sunkii]GHN13175.1 poly-gamma-glutamate biosynthesis protein [Lactobacillus delbrueckii subsp. sunkii]GHN14743.1 poly-gamma-glutamate biosynthesis protein [Lactobacillus delbrueckii subsp. sunkii]
MKKKSLGVNALLSGLQSLLNVIFPFITFPYISRVLDVSGVGKVNFASSIISYFSLIAALGINMFAIREGAKLRDNRKAISEFASKILTINLISTLIAYVLLAITILVVPILHRYTDVIVLLSSQIILTTIGVNWLYTIFEEYSYMMLRDLIFKIVSVVLLFTMVRHHDDYLNYAAVSVISSAGSYLLNFFHARKYCDFKLNFDFNWQSYIKPILLIFASMVAIQIYVNSDTTMLGFMKGNYSVGIYSVSVKVYTIVANLLASALFVTIPRLSMLLGKKRYREYNSLLGRLINTLIVIVLPSIIGLIMLSKDVVAIIAGAKYASSAISLQILTLALIFKLMCSVFNECALIPLKRENKSLIAFALAAVLNIGINFIAIPFMSERGAAMTTVLAEFTAMAVCFYYGRDTILPVVKNSGTIYNLITVLIGSVGIVGICLFGNILISQRILRIAVNVIASGILYAVLLLIMKNQTALGLLEQIKERLQH